MDERNVPLSSDDSNYKAAHEQLLKKVGWGHPGWGGWQRRFAGQTASGASAGRLRAVRQRRVHRACRVCLQCNSGGRT